MNASISRSRSTTRRVATDWTRPGAQPAGHLLPEQRRDLVADDTVEDPPGLLGVDAVGLDRTRVAERVLDLRLGDRVEDDALGVLDRVVQRVGDVPGDRLPFAVQVGREPDVFRQLRRLLEVGDGLLRVVHHLVGGLEVVVQVHAGHRHLDALRVAGRQVADVADTGHHAVVLAEVLVDRLGLGRRFNDH